MLQIKPAELSDDMHVDTHLNLHALKTYVCIYGSSSNTCTAGKQDLTSRQGSCTYCWSSFKHVAVPMAPRASPASCRTLPGDYHCQHIARGTLLTECQHCAYMQCSWLSANTSLRVLMAAASCLCPKQYATSCLNKAEASFKPAGRWSVRKSLSARQTIWEGFSSLAFDNSCFSSRSWHVSE